MWIAISEFGMSKTHFFKSDLAVSAETYKKYCVPKIAEFIIRNSHMGKNVIFWPDLASCHYVRTSLDKLTRFGISVVPKDKKAPNVPQLRPIEDFWANLKRKVYANNYTSKNIKCLKNKIKLELEKMQHSVFSKAMKHVPAKCRKDASSGLNIFIH